MSSHTKETAKSLLSNEMLYFFFLEFPPPNAVSMNHCEVWLGLLV